MAGRTDRTEGGVAYEMSDANDAMIESLSELQKELAEIRAGLDKAWATVQEMTVVALRSPVDFSVPMKYDNPHDDR